MMCVFHKWIRYTVPGEIEDRTWGSISIRECEKCQRKQVRVTSWGYGGESKDHWLNLNNNQTVTIKFHGIKKEHKVNVDWTKKKAW